MRRHSEPKVNGLRLKRGTLRSQFNPIRPIAITALITGVIFFCRVTGWRGNRRGYLASSIPFGDALRLGILEVIPIFVITYVVVIVVRRWSVKRY